MTEPTQARPSRLERPGRIDLPCPACREVVPLWIERADLRIDRYAGGLGGDVTVAGAHYCTAQSGPEGAPDA